MYYSENELLRMRGHSLDKKSRKKLRNRILISKIIGRFGETQIATDIGRAWLLNPDARFNQTSGRALFKKRMQSARPSLTVRKHTVKIERINFLRRNLRVYKTIKKSESLHFMVYGYNRKLMRDFLESDYQPSTDDLNAMLQKLRRQSRDIGMVKGTDYNYYQSFLHVPIEKRPRYSQIFSKYDKAKSHRPFTRDKAFFGVEIECIFPNQKSYELFQTLVEKVPYVSIGTDGSIKKESPENKCVEIRVLTEDSFSNLEKVCLALKESKAFVNKSCGLHVHIDFRSNKKTIAQRTLYSRLNDNLLGLVAMFVPETRRTNRFCLKRTSKEKYSYVNTSTLGKYGTVEIRLHTGTTNFSKIKNWIDLWKYLLYSPRLKSFDNTNLKSFLDALPDRELAAYLLERARLFNKKDVLEAHGINNIALVINNETKNDIELNESDELCVNF